jgi:hypothetical protein
MSVLLGCLGLQESASGVLLSRNSHILKQLTGLQALRQDVSLSRAQYRDAVRKRCSIDGMLR